jgi:deoxyribonuclease V
VKPVIRSRWNLTPRQAIRVQQRLRQRLILADRVGKVESVAGADIAFDPVTQMAVAGVIVYRFPQMEELERRFALRPLRFPYVPGLLSFREIPVLLSALTRLRRQPDVIFVDGHGLAHPRRFGIACHLGVLLDKPTLGCAKSLLTGEEETPDQAAGSTADLRLEHEVVGKLLRTRAGVKPVYISQGHRIALPTAVRLAWQCSDGYRIPRPTRDADKWVRALRVAFQQGSLQGRHD